MGFAYECVIWTGAEGVDVEYCNGKVDVGVGPCNETRSDHTPPARGCGDWAGGGIG